MSKYRSVITLNINGLYMYVCVFMCKIQYAPIKRHKVGTGIKLLGNKGQGLKTQNDYIANDKNCIRRNMSMSTI